MESCFVSLRQSQPAEHSNISGHHDWCPSTKEARCKNTAALLYVENQGITTGSQSYSGVKTKVIKVNQRLNANGSRLLKTS